jgi:translation initiation factor IF-2
VYCDIKLHVTDSFEITDAQQAQTINSVKNAKLKFLKTNAVIWSNKICRINQLTRKYVTIKIKGNNQENKNTKLAAIRYRLGLSLVDAASGVL